MKKQVFEEKVNEGIQVSVTPSGVTTLNDLQATVAFLNYLIAVLAEGKPRELIQSLTDALQLEIAAIITNDYAPDDYVGIGTDRTALEGQGAAEYFSDYIYEQAHIAHYKEATVTTIDGSSYTIQRGSKISTALSSSMPDKLRNMVRDLIADGKIKADGTLLVDVTVKSKSAAAAIIAGCNINGKNTPLGKLV